jgi:hypothetical protein
MERKNMHTMKTANMGEKEEDNDEVEKNGE